MGIQLGEQGGKLSAVPILAELALGGLDESTAFERGDAT